MCYPCLAKTVEELSWQINYHAVITIDHAKTHGEEGLFSDADVISAMELAGFVLWEPEKAESRWFKMVVNRKDLLGQVYYKPEFFDPNNSDKHRFIRIPREKEILYFLDDEYIAPDGTADNIDYEYKPLYSAYEIYAAKFYDWDED